jgi:anhydro-N-acetylmuramic acid kinase
MADNVRLIAGAMSGTSADGVDVAITRIKGRGLQMSCELVHHHAHPYPPELRNRIFAVRGGGNVSLKDLADLGRDISLAYLRAVNDALAAANLRAEDIAAVAAHGQTLFHDPPNTIQWLDPALLAAEVGCAVVSDFRRADCAAGGQGAPLVPFADYLMFRDEGRNRAMLNIGGIANLTYLPAGGALDDVIAFDTGPGNCISDWLCRNHEPTGPGYDVDGAGAAAGESQTTVALAVAGGRYVRQPPPKSTDGPAMIALYLQAKRELAWQGSFADELATACEATLLSILKSLDLHLPQWKKAGLQDVLVSGGGVRNKPLLNLLAGLLSTKGVGVTALDPTLAQAKEAIAFALLAAATLDGEPSNVPSATGAKRRVILGSITPKP